MNSQDPKRYYAEDDGPLYDGFESPLYKKSIVPSRWDGWDTVILIIVLLFFAALACGAPMILIF